MPGAKYSYVLYSRATLYSVPIDGPLTQFCCFSASAIAWFGSALTQPPALSNRTVHFERGILSDERGITVAFSSLPLCIDVCVRVFRKQVKPLCRTTFSCQTVDLMQQYLSHAKFTQVVITPSLLTKSGAVSMLA